MGPHPLEGTDEHPEPGGVDEVDAAEVDHDAEPLVVDQLDQLLTQARGGGHVDLAADLEHRPATLLRELES